MRAKLNGEVMLSAFDSGLNGVGPCAGQGDHVVGFVGNDDLSGQPITLVGCFFFRGGGGGGESLL